VFWRAPDGSLWNTSWDNGRYWEATQISKGPMASPPSPVCGLKAGQVDVFWKAPDGSLWDTWYDGSVWADKEIYRFPQRVPRAVKWTGPVTKNPDGAWLQQILAGPLPDDVRFVTALEPFKQGGYGLVDFRMYYGGDNAHATIRATRNFDGSGVFKTLDNAPITNITVREEDKYGVTDVSFTANGYESGWIAHSGAESRSFKNVLPPNSILVGVQAKAQGGYGIVDLNFAYVSDTA